MATIFIDIAGTKAEVAKAISSQTGAAAITDGDVAVAGEFERYKKFALAEVEKERGPKVGVHVKRHVDASGSHLMFAITSSP
jgi:hypothetical protein